MADDLDTLMVEVRADTRAFAADMDRLRSSVDGSLTGGFARAGRVLEDGLLTAIRRGSVGFDELRDAAFRALSAIAAEAVRSGLHSLLGGTGGPGGAAAGGGGLAGVIGGALGALLGLPGRSTGGLVSPHRPVLVGERGPEVFVPASAGRIEPNRGAGPARDVRVAITLAAPPGASAPVALQRSGRQVASAIRRAMAD
ncbi:tail tape measure protein [Erythrobacteraceae bacterium CFH 75059]|uniref:tail tape measure protein n=1 Tax=Qipengyuania thermophila TaxID=2509361 RepID=UPI00101EDF1E|nr:tail tape measure protein [Qipengyuania thermophila]TCD06843.1 tail tape measure protein [Erythrobacteraceae bacterium CFH 75059]